MERICMIKPKKLKRGDKIAIVSLSWGGLGDDALIIRKFLWDILILQ